MAYIIERQGRVYDVFDADTCRLVAAALDCLGAAEQRVEELEQADREEAEAEARDDADIPPRPPYTISRSHDGGETFLIVRDLGGIVATVSYDHHAGQWSIAASTDRFAKHDDLPDVFCGYFHNHANRFGDVFRFFGCQLPGAGAISDAKETAA